MDPKAEKYYNISPTIYVDNNPINAIDPTGEEIIFIVRGQNGAKDQSFKYSKGNFYHANGKRYNPSKESINKTMYQLLTVYRKIEKGDDKVLKNQLKTLETSKKNHFIEEGNKNRVKVYDPERVFVSETKEAIKNGESIGTHTTLNFSEAEKKELEKSQGVPDTNATIVTHEMQHQYDYDQGNMADSQGKEGAESPTEQRAVKNENRMREKEGLPKRTTYGGVELPE